MGLFMTPFHMLPGVLSGFHPMLGAALPFASGYHGFPYPSPTVHQMPSPNVVTEDDFQKIIQIHRKRRLANEVLFTDSVFSVYAKNNLVILYFVIIVFYFEFRPF